MKTIRIALLAVPMWAHLAAAQITEFPYVENFDTLPSLQLPAGWSTTTNKNLGGDFAVTGTSARSAPNAVSATDATKSQSLLFPVFDFSGVIPDSLFFFERRTSTFRAKVVIEALIEGDTLTVIPVSRDSLHFLSGTAYVRRALALPETLSDRANVRLRLRIIADTAGSSGVYRIDDVRVTKKKRTDAAIVSLIVTPTAVRSGDSVSIDIGMKNLGLAGQMAGSVTLTDSNTIIAVANVQWPWSAAETVSFRLTYPDIPPGRHPLTVSVAVPGDEDTTNNSRSFVVNAGFRPGTVIINEILYAPPAGVPEWVELFAGGNAPLSIAGWRISDATANRAALLPQHRIIPAGTYFIVTTDTMAWSNHFSTDVPLLQASFSSLNNSGDALVLYDLTGAVIDSLFYHSSWGGSGGRSLERIDGQRAAADKVNWGTSTHPAGSTPGAVNSLSQKPFDAAITQFAFSPPFPTIGQTMSAEFVVANIGKNSLAAVELRMFFDTDNDSVPDTEEEIFRDSRPSLGVNDSVVVTVPLPSLPHGYHRFFLRVRAEADDDTMNNTAVSTLSIGLPPQSVVITEIMYAPAGDGPEWVECRNNSPTAIDLSQWTISDAGQTKQPIRSSGKIPANSYFVITADTTALRMSYANVPVLLYSLLPSLNNTTPDAVVLTDERGRTMDSLLYRPSWGGSGGLSLQRYDLFGSSTDSGNWISAAPTPGKEFPFSRADYDLSVRGVQWESAPPVVRITAAIVNEGRALTGAATVHFYHDRNRDSLGRPEELFRSIALYALPPNDSAVVSAEWNLVEPGEHRLLTVLEYPSDERLQNNTFLCSVKRRYPERSMVINEILFEPEAGSPEFAEIHNPSPDTIDLEGWTLMDQPSSSGARTIIRFDQSLHPVEPRGFVVIASDSLILQRVPAGSDRSVVIHPSFSLNNNGEDLVLTDLTGARIDSLRYSPSWHLRHLSPLQRSLERIDPAGRSTDGRNWSSSVAPTGSTPLANNSIMTRSLPSASLGLSPNPFSPDGDGREDFLSINFSLPASSSTVRIRIFDVHGRLIRHLVSGEPAASPASFLWNGADDTGEKVRIGMYIVLIEALDNFGGVITAMKEVAVVAKKL